MWFDTHAHLDFEDFAPDLDAVLARARANGVTEILTIGTTPAKNRATLELAARHAGVYAAVGIHPHDAAAAAEGGVAVWEEFERMAADPRVRAIGEMGLDYAKNYSPREVQMAAFRRQLEIADRLGKPVILHCRQAFDDCLALVREMLRPPVRAVAHCFSGDAPMAARFVELGFFISFAGPLTYPKSEHLRAAAAAVPADRVLVETDCPFLAPQAHRGKRNEPGYVVETGAALARARGLAPLELAALATANARRAFGLPAEART
ncbi:MAG: TatD family hydrolase [Planctomycetes bacterium]|nr:TatD family hydrolase [Planctomycetota bacterium]